MTVKAGNIIHLERNNTMISEKNRMRGLRLLKKGKKGISRVIFSRVGLMILLMASQAWFLFSIFLRFEEILPHVYGGSILFSVGMVLYLLNVQMNPTAKITWLIIMMLVPVFGALLFLYTQSDFGHRALKARFSQLISETKDSIVQQEDTIQALEAEDPGAASLAHYLKRCGCHPVYKNTSVTYFPLGEDKFAELLIQLQKAEHFIFLEYFIIEEGQMWGQVLEILAHKAKLGVDVRVLYDGTCEFSLLPHDYPNRLKDFGIQCKVFAPAMPFISTHYNYRDHRKILVIDGHTAFNGGINLADEYINQVVRFGHWKDTAVMLKGDAVKSFTLMFLQMWDMDEKEMCISNFLEYPTIPQKHAQGYVIPYGDCPLDNDKLGERVYMDILNRARTYVHIMSPYLILDGEMETALKFAAERGVEVALILPGIPDKYIPYALAKTHYTSLLESGIQIYEYTLGFVHAKVFISDSREAVVGTINLDYRSLYHHFECATYMHGTECIPHIEADFQDTLRKCRKVTPETIRNEDWKVKLTGVLAKVAAPLL